jgi:CHAT domain-containing protein
LLALSLSALYWRTGDPAVLAEVVEIGRDIVSSAPLDYSYRSIYLGNLSDYISDQWQLTGDAALLSQSIDVGRAAVVAAGSDLIYRASNLSRLAQRLLALARLTGKTGLITEAAGAARQAVHMSKDTHPDHAIHMTVLGSARTHLGIADGDEAALVEARDSLSQAATFPLASTDQRINASQRWAAAAMHLGQVHEAEHAYQHAVDLLIECVGPALTWADREHTINEAGGLPGDAAAAALAAGDPDMAVTLLERSRGVLLAEALHSRLDLDALGERSPGLAEAFGRISRELSDIDLPRLDAAGSGPTPIWVARRRMDLAAEWQHVCAQVREVPGFEEFLLPPSLSAIRDATCGGTVAIVNVSRWRCDAILISETTTQSVPLPALSIADCLVRASQYLLALRSQQAAVRELLLVRKEISEDAGAAAYQRYHAAKTAAMIAGSAVDEILAGLLAWLWDVVAEPIVDHLGLDETNPHRIWWCPIGPLVLLPLHAAGHLGDQKRSLLNRVISSYAPTLRALVTAHRSRSTAADPRMLVVAMPRTLGQAPLPNAARERDHLRSLFPSPHSTILSDAAATRDNVVQALASHQWVHFSCHGEQIMDAPADSGLLLADGRLTVAGIISKKLTGEFVFLCACMTAASSSTMLNETITLASALHYAGYRHVIATLWSVLDNVSADLAMAVYDALTATGSFRPMVAATALCAAVLELRTEYPNQPSVWAPFVHIGI